DRNLRGQVGRIDVVVGPANLGFADIETAAGEIAGTVLHRALPSLSPLMRGADLVLTAGGNTMVEALALRKACLVTVTGNQQAPLAARLRDEPLVLSLGEPTTTAASDILKMIARALDERDAMAARIRSAAPFDHLGAGRVAEMMLSPAPASA